MNLEDLVFHPVVLALLIVWLALGIAVTGVTGWAQLMKARKLRREEKERNARRYC